MKCTRCQQKLSKQIVCKDCFTSQAVVPFIIYKTQKKQAIDRQIEIVHNKIHTIKQQASSDSVLKRQQWPTEKLKAQHRLRRIIQLKAMVAATNYRIKRQIAEKQKLQEQLKFRTFESQMYKEALKQKQILGKSLENQVINLEICKSTLLAKCIQRQTRLARDAIFMTPMPDFDPSKYFRLNLREVVVIEEEQEIETFMQTLQVQNSFKDQYLLKYSLFLGFIRLYLLSKIMHLKLPYALKFNAEKNTMLVGSKSLLRRANGLGNILRFIMVDEQILAINQEALMLLQANIQCISSLTGLNFKDNQQRILNISEDLFLRTVQNKWNGFYGSFREWNSWFYSVKAVEVLADREQAQKQGRQIMVFFDAEESNQIIEVQSDESLEDRYS